jgi:hypothetical protein
VHDCDQLTRFPLCVFRARVLLFLTALQKSSGPVIGTLSERRSSSDSSLEPNAAASSNAAVMASLMTSRTMPEREEVRVTSFVYELQTFCRGYGMHTSACCWVLQSATLGGMLIGSCCCRLWLYSPSAGCCC